MDGWDWIRMEISGWVKYRAPYGANNFCQDICPPAFLQIFGDQTLRIVGVINQGMRPSLATGECQIPDVWDYPILASSSPSPLLLLPPSIHLESYQFIATDQL